MATDKPCSFGCGRWARVKSDVCETCAANRSLHKGHKPAQRMKYRQRLALATRRQTEYANEFGDEPVVKEIEMIEPDGKGKGRRKAEVIPFRRKKSTTRRRA